MLYRILRPYVHLFFRIFYKYQVRGLENIPADRPVVLAPNHVNAFMDAIALAVIQKKKVRFFARGDVFKGKTARYFLEKLSISPMYRLQEGYSEIKKNDKTFEECRMRLTNNEIILLFPEAICVQELKLRPLKKGLARIVFQTEETLDFKKDVLVIPVGLNYSAASKFRSRFFIDIGKPVSVKEYEASFKQDKVKTINEFTRMLEQKMAPHMVILNNTANERLFRNIEEMCMQQWLKEKGQDEKNLLQRHEAEQELAAMINDCEEKDPALITSLTDKTTQYIRRVKGNGLRDHLLRPENVLKIGNLGTFIAQFFVIYLGMIVYGIGLLLNYPPYFGAKKFSDERIKSIEFFASVYANLAMIFWTVYYLIQLLIVALVFRNWPLLAIYAVSVPVLGYFCVWYYPVKEKIFGRWRLLRMVRKERPLVEELMSERNEIVSLVNSVQAAYYNSRAGSIR